MENVGVCEKNRDVAVGVGGSVVLQGNRCPIELHGPLSFKDLLRDCSRGPGRKGKVPAYNPRRCGEMLSCVGLSEDGCTSRVQPFVAVGVVEVPVRVDEVPDGIGT